MSLSTPKKILALSVFIALGFLAMQVPFSKMLGATNLKFSLFDFYGPIVGAFIGALPGMLVVLAMQLVNWAVSGFHTDLGTIIRFFPILAATLYFAKNSKWTLLIPTVAIIAFLAHPQGRMAWPFALYWLIPFVAHFFRSKFIFARALGATFTQHALGGALWVWGLNMKAAVWMSLIPLVWKERGLMAIGITLTYLAMNALIKYVSAKTSWNITSLQPAQPSISTPTNT